MGAPGTSYWTGSVLVFNTSSGQMSVYLDDEAGAVNFGSYLGNRYTCYRAPLYLLYPLLQNDAAAGNVVPTRHQTLYTLTQSNKGYTYQSVAPTDHL